MHFHIIHSAIGSSTVEVTIHVVIHYICSMLLLHFSTFSCLYCYVCMYKAMT